MFPLKYWARKYFPKFWAALGADPDTTATHSACFIHLAIEHDDFVLIGAPSTYTTDSYQLEPAFEYDSLDTKVYIP